MVLMVNCKQQLPAALQEMGTHRTIACHKRILPCGHMLPFLELLRYWPSCASPDIKLVLCVQNVSIATYVDEHLSHFVSR